MRGIVPYHVCKLSFSGMESDRNKSNDLQAISGAVRSKKICIWLLHQNSCTERKNAFPYGETHSFYTNQTSINVLRTDDGNTSRKLILLRSIPFMQQLSKQDKRQVTLSNHILRDGEI